jgi:hypothetical protein
MSFSFESLQDSAEHYREAKLSGTSQILILFAMASDLKVFSASSDQTGRQ